MNNSIAVISPTLFAKAMDKHWTSSLNNISSDALRQVWQDLGAAFSSQIWFHDDPDRNMLWHVLQPPTGSGKSQGTAVYCAMLATYPVECHPGVLIVTRLKDDADKMAACINRLAEKKDYAFSFHSDKDAEGTRETLLRYPILVITHRAYELALKRLQENAVKQSWEDFYSWQKRGRMLVVIDEALEIIEDSQVDLDGIRLTLGAIPQTIRDVFPREIQAILSVIAILEEKAASGDGKEAFVPRYRPDDGHIVDLIKLRQALRQVRFDHQQNRSAFDENLALFRKHDDRLQAAQNILDGDVYYAKIPSKGHTLNSSKLLVPHDVKGAVVLDATASANVIYQLFGKAEVRATPEGVRTYANVTLNVNRGLNVGKVHLRKNADQLLPVLMADLNRRLAGRSVFFVTHDELEKKVVGIKTDFNISVGHWGAVDGSNKWMECDTAVLFGLRSMPTTWTANRYFALQGMKDTDWLRATQRPFKNHTDIRHSLRSGQTISEIVQAINRIRCRRVIDANGNCPDAEIYLFLPDGPSGDEMLARIREMMKEVRVRPWVIDGITENDVPRGRPRVSGNVQLMLLTHLRSMMPGRLSKTVLRSETGVTDSTLKRFISDAKDKNTEIAKTLKSWGISFVCEGLGRNAKSYFVR